MFIVETILFWLFLFISIRLLKRKFNNPNYKGKIVWITGASKGLGQYLAYQLNQKGARLILSARNQKQLNRVKNACKNPQQVIVVPLDMVKYKQTRIKTQKVIQQLKNKGEKIDVVIQNAGASYISSIAQIQFEEYLNIINLNLNSVYNHLQPIIKSMIQNKSGHIVGITSVAGKLSLSYAGPYSASKSAFIGLLDTLRTQLQPFDITVTNIYPGYVKSKILEILPQHQNPEVNAVMEIQKKNVAAGMDTQRFSKQTVKAMYNKQTEVHISDQNWMLPFGVFIRAVVPDLFFWLAKRFYAQLRKKIEKTLKKN